MIVVVIVVYVLFVVRSEVRFVLYMAAQTAVKHNPAIRVVYEVC